MRRNGENTFCTIFVKAVNCLCKSSCSIDDIVDNQGGFSRDIADQVQGSDSVVILADPQGMLLHSMGDAAFAEALDYFPATPITTRSAAYSYLSLVEANARSIARGNPTEWSDATDAQKSNWLRQAAAAGIDIIFGPRWSGYRRTDTQSLDWPRIGASDSRTGRYVTETTVPTSVKWAQFEFALSLALGVDPLRNLDPSDPAERTAWASSTTDKLPGGLEESRTYDRGSPIYAVLARMEAFAAPLLMSDDQVGVA